MEFLYRLYSNSYFGIGLFIVMTILVFSFLVVLFFGKKDEKARSKMENNIDNQEETKVEEIKIPIEEDLKVESLATMSEDKDEVENVYEIPSLEVEEDIVEPSQTQESIPEIEEDEEDNVFISDIFSLKPNLDNIETENVDEVSVEDFNNNETIFESEKIDDDTISMDIPAIQEVEESNIFTEDSEIDEMPVRKQPSSPIFSSVYLNGGKKEEESKEAEDVSVRPTPRKPEFELPKKIELPKLNKESQDDSINSIFSHLEDESYNIDKK